MRCKGLKGKESRTRLLNAATYEFAHSGYHDTKVSTIVARAGLTQAAFYLYFSSKEAIFDELIADFRTRLHALIEKVRLAPGIEAKEVPERIRATLEAFFRFLAADPDLTRLGLLVAPDAEQIKRELASLVANNLQAEQIAGYFRPDLPVEILAECMLGMVERLTIHWLFTGEKDPQSLALHVAKIIMNGAHTPDASVPHTQLSALEEK